MRFVTAVNIEINASLLKGGPSCGMHTAELGGETPLGVATNATDGAFLRFWGSDEAAYDRMPV